MDGQQQQGMMGGGGMGGMMQQQQSDYDASVTGRMTGGIMKPDKVIIWGIEVWVVSLNFFKINLEKSKKFEFRDYF